MVKLNILIYPSDIYSSFSSEPGMNACKRKENGKMKEIVFILLLLTFAVSEAGASIKGTPHDVNVMRNSGKELETCAMCHTPHSSVDATPLWDRHQLPQNYAMYESPTFDMNEQKELQPPSTYCMTCHNGVSSGLVNYPGPGSKINPLYNISDNDSLFSAFSNMGTDLKNNHPVSFTYDPSLDVDNNGFPYPRPVGAGGGKAVVGSRGKYPLYGAGGDQFECSTCHDVHNTVDYAGKGLAKKESSGRQIYFLRADNSGSGMCTDCHVNR